jgi:starch synthase (maltosyl-transferring)
VANEAQDAICSVNRALSARAAGHAGPLRQWTGPAAPVTLTTRGVGCDALLLAENNTAAEVSWPPPTLPPMPWQSLAPAPGFGPATSLIPARGCVLCDAKTVAPPPASAELARSLQSATRAANDAHRVVIAGISPSLDAGAFAVKCIVGQPVTVAADIFVDGHEQLAAAVLTRARGETAWTRTPLSPQGNDVWTADVRFVSLGRHEFRVEAWIDRWGGLMRDLARKRADGQDVTLELREAQAMIAAALADASRDVAPALNAVLRNIADGAATFQVELLFDQALAAAMDKAVDHRFRATSFIQPVQVEREAARFSSWYELFPRSMSGDPRRHGTFVDVIASLPHIAAMGFDTLYFPPIHPIGVRNRKGRNNSIAAAPDDVGSPYAIGSAHGGHTAIHPELGTLDDFHRLLREAAAHGLEVALDFAIQCAPDHPWLSEHPGWFAWRPDGSIKYAENPPKKYQDIVNVDFYAHDAVPDLWCALRDVVLFWIDHGVRVFRVDNPHTKPMPFWAWMIADVQARDPEVIFLSEAFTRPRPMYHLAKAGFSQSYTYFTWRNDKVALTEYMTELIQTDLRNYFRPHFFVNTPDINPLFLQTAGRAGFLIRAALASTLSGLWGIYSGFELCESASLPGREEYRDSEKYELRQRPPRGAGDVVDEITQLNRLRRTYPALQSHLGITFHNAFNEQVLYFSKSAPAEPGRLLVAISLNPHGVEEADFEMPLWLFRLPDWETLDVEDLLGKRAFQWTGKIQHLRLTPTLPYAIWHVSAPHAA